MKYSLVLPLFLVSCSINPVVEFQHEGQLTLKGLDFPKEGMRVSVHPPAQECRQLGILSLETIPNARLVHEVFKFSRSNGDTYFTEKANFYPSLLKESIWIAEDPDIQQSLDSLVNVAAIMGGDLIADFELQKPVYQILSMPNGNNIILRESTLFLSKSDDIQLIQAAVLSGLVCTCDSVREE